MSEHDGTDDPYRTPSGEGSSPAGGSPLPGSQRPGSQPSVPPPYPPPPPGGQGYPGPPQPPQAYPPYPGQSLPGQPSPGQAYPGQPYPGQAYPGQPYPTQGGWPPFGGPEATKPPAVVRLVQVMLAGAVAALLQGVYSAFVVDDLLTAGGDLDEVAVESGIDPAAFAETAGVVGLVVVALSTVVSVGLWLLFARLFDHGTGRVAGTVLAGINALGTVVGLLAPEDLIDWVLSAITMALVVAGLVLLWRPASSAWFRAVAASKGAWG